MEINRKSVVFSAAGGSLDFVSADGEVLFSVPVPAGRTRAAEYLDPHFPSKALISLS